MKTTQIFICAITGFFLMINGLTYSLSAESAQLMNHKKLTQPLYELYKSENRALVAKKYGLKVVNDKVLVNLTLQTHKYTIPPQYGAVTRQLRDQCEAMIYIDQLITLTEEPNIRSIDVPINPVILGGGNDEVETFQKKFFYYGAIAAGAISVLFVIFYLILRKKKQQQYYE